ncbi:hypothetical protein [Rhodococcus tukisamuensis]|uniref:hypothetical protein n=1 Tax=Rhodococcus tukisamuensis TaxID=168276 RepID=UPI0011135323|nr:hypothetical protein [Rhodococcus tukisamuensis]
MAAAMLVTGPGADARELGVECTVARNITTRIGSAWCTAPRYSSFRVRVSCYEQGNWNGPRGYVVYGAWIPPKAQGLSAISIAEPCRSGFSPSATLEGPRTITYLRYEPTNDQDRDVYRIS